MNQKEFLGALLGLAMAATSANATVSPFFSSSSDCTNPITSMNFLPSGTNLTVSLCVTTTAENVCGATIQLQTASAAEDGHFKVISRSHVGSALSDPNSTISFPVSITNPKQVADFGATVGTGTPVPPVGPNQLLATFVIQPQASAQNNSYVLSLSSLSAVAIEPTNCFGSPTDTPIAKTLTLNKTGGVLKAKRFDFNGDTMADVFWRNMGGGGSGDNYIWPMSGTTVLGTEGATRSIPDLNWVAAGMGDFTGDQKVDVLWRNSSTGDNYMWPLNGTTVLPGEGSVRAIADTNWVVAGVADFNNDGKDDILWHNNATGANYMWFMNGTSIIGEGSVRAIPDLNYTVAAVGDFDLDGFADIVWRNPVNGVVYFWPMNGTTVLAGEGTIRVVNDPNWQIKGYGDFNGDSRTDLLWYNSSTGDTYVWMMSGLTVTSEGLARGISDLTWQIATVANFTADAKADILWRNTVSGQTYLWPMDGATIGAGEGFVRTVPVGNWTIVSK